MTPVTIAPARPAIRGTYIRAYCAGFTFRTPSTDGWQGRVREWAARVRLPSGATLQLRRVTGCLCGPVHVSTVGAVQS